MNKLQNQLKSISASLMNLSRKVETISQQLEKLKPPKTTTKKAKASKTRIQAVSKRRPAAESTVIDSVFEVIKKSRGRATTAKVKEITGLGARQVSNALYKLTKQGKIISISRGVYAKK
jgi:predicted Rossmann fold nucleotide-binding protein DprA/Smf involved in DNA uptake